MPKISLSYRRDDSGGIAGWIYDRLRARFGSDAVFMDIDNVPFGVDFREHIDSAVSQCDVVLAVIGTKWAGETDAHRRLDDPRDFVRIELESALHRNLPVIPILIGYARMPTGADLPPSLTRLAFRNAIDVDQGRDFDRHVDRLVRGIEFHFQRLKIPAAPPLSEAREAAPTLPAAPEPDRPRVASGRQELAVSSELVGAPPQRRNVPWLWFYLAAVPLLAFLGIIIHEQGGNKKAASPSPSAADSSKPASPTTHVESPKLALPSQKPRPSSPQPIRAWTNSIGIKLVRIEAGEFLMGTTKHHVEQLMRLYPDSPRELFDDEQPAHLVRLSKAFCLGIHEVTQGQYQAVMGDNPSQFKGSDDLPVEKVSWLDAVKFCIKLSEREQQTPFYRTNGTEVTPVGGDGYRLPTEAEWEYACRAKNTTLYSFGNDAGKLDEHAWTVGNSESKTRPVGLKLPNAWGLYDMLGNVWEWCADGYDAKYYASSPSAGPPGAPRTPFRVFRGGSWSNVPRGCRLSRRGGHLPAGRQNYLGFRVALVQG